VLKWAATFEGFTPLMTATLNNDIEIAKMLINEEANINIADNQGMTALMLAAREGYLAILTILLMDAGTSY
jgi:ankyrin repeat protein